MWQGSYGKEPFDLRLTVLRLIRKLHMIAGVTILGTLLFGGGYYVKNVVLRDEPVYAVTSAYRVEFAVEEEKDVGTVYINEVTWNTYMQSGMFLDAVQLHLAENNTLTDGSRLTLTNQDLARTLKATLASDLRVPSTTVTTNSPEESVLIAKAVEQAMTREFAEQLREVLSISVIDAGVNPKEVIPDVRVGRAVGLSAVLSAFFVTVVLLLKELGDDSIWLPVSLWKRYGIKTVGTLESVELAENIKYFFGGKTNVAVCPVREQTDPARVIELLKERCLEAVAAEDGGKNVFQSWFAAPAPLLCPEICGKLREADGILLAVTAGSHEGKALERVVEFLEQQDIKVTAAILLDADEKLIRGYYFGRKA